MSKILELAKEDTRRFSIFPIKYPELYKHFKNHQATNWTSEEIDLSQDVRQFNEKLNDKERHFLKHVLAFFAQSDGIVNENLAIRFYKDVPIAEARAFYTMQMLIETVHAETYGLLLDSFVSNEEEKEKLFNAVETMPTIAKKAQWAMKYLRSKEDFTKRLLAFAIVEGIFFSGSFCAIYWFKKRGLMPGLGMSNEFISRDEGLHWQFAVELYKTLGLSISEDEFRNMVKEAVEIEAEFVSGALPVEMLGINSSSMIEYIEFVSDQFSLAFGFKPIFNSKNPFEWANLQNFERKTNFFEKRVSEYQKSMDKNLSFDEDF